MYYKKVKRSLDFTLALITLILLSPVLIAISLIVKLDSEGPVIFKQKRIGLHKKEFYILKFRTMRVDAPSNCPTHLLDQNIDYTTRVGRILRKYSLDELPQLINIVVGEMSIVGPRPALWNQYDLIAERDRYKANEERPGLTGWAQVNGRDEISIEEKARLDGEYVRRISFLFDVKCIWRTIYVVLKHEGVAEGGEDKGSEKPSKGSITTDGKAEQ